MHTPWIGSRKIAVIPAVVNDPTFNPPPANWVDLIRQRIFYDPDPASGVDRSLRAYIHTISYGKALLEADIYNPVTAPWSHCGATQDAAIQATPAVHSYGYACVVFTGGTHGCGGWAFYDNPPFPFNPPPPSGTNNLRNWCYVSMDESLGVWSMELMHAMTGFGDLYNTNPHPGNFDNMACNCGTHPSTYTKLKLGWLDPSNVPTATVGGASTFTLHALALLQPPPPGRVTAVKIPSTISQRYFLVEARLRVDPYERVTPGVSSGIPSEGVVVYEINEATWPVRLRTPTALSVGQKYSNQAEQLEIAVIAAVPGGATVLIHSTENPKCTTLRDNISEAEAEILSLQEKLQHAAPGEKPGIVSQIKRWQAKRTSAKQEAVALGCRLN